MFMAQSSLCNGMKYGFIRYKSVSDAEGLLSQLQKINIGEELLRVYVAYDRNRRVSAGRRDGGVGDNRRYNCKNNKDWQRNENVGDNPQVNRSYIDMVNGGYKRGVDESKIKMMSEDRGVREMGNDCVVKRWNGRTIETEEKELNDELMGRSIVGEGKARCFLTRLPLLSEEQGLGNI
ncbi:transposon TX1 [Tanacetum coccineum]